jgi:hypothetical protein
MKRFVPSYVFLAVACLAVSVRAAENGAEAEGTALLGGSIVDIQAVPFKTSAMVAGGLDGTGGPDMSAQASKNAPPADEPAICRPSCLIATIRHVIASQERGQSRVSHGDVSLQQRQHAA